jgi:hypothetical protein
MQVMEMVQNFDEVRLVFDRYIKDSLKERTRKKRTSGKEVRYKVSYSTNIANITLKELLSHIETKQQLTEYLAKHFIYIFSSTNKRYVVSYDTLTESNCQELIDGMAIHDHEEADTLIILHCLNIARNNPFSECTVYSPDTDVFLLLIHHYEMLTQALMFRTGRGKDIRDIDIGSCHESLKPSQIKALLGFHTLTGCDQIGKFNGKTKTFWWKQFVDCNNDVLEALADLGNTFIYIQH